MVSKGSCRPSNAAGLNPREQLGSPDFELLASFVVGVLGVAEIHALKFLPELRAGLDLIEQRAINGIKAHQRQPSLRHPGDQDSDRHLTKAPEVPESDCKQS